MISDESWKFTLAEYKQMISTYRNAPIPADLDKVWAELELFLKKYLN